MMAPEHRENNLAMIRKVKEIADEKGVTLSQLALAWSLAKYDHVQSLIGTTNPAHLQAAIDALKLELSAEDITRIETAPDADKVGGKGMRNFVFTEESYKNVSVGDTVTCRGNYLGVTNEFGVVMKRSEVL